MSASPVIVTDMFKHTESATRSEISRLEHTGIRAAILRSYHGQSLRRLATMLRHPRSLARVNPGWRPPTLHVTTPESGRLDITVSRKRVSPHARALLRDEGYDSTAAYMVQLRFTHPDGRRCARSEAEAWIRALLPDEDASKVHEITTALTPTLCWLVTASGRVVDSPADWFGTVSDGEPTAA
ncbi:Uncharacterised protein [Corynebacterium renale]|nr:Uncharacterised protein [Corynebacterium renale]